MRRHRRISFSLNDIMLSYNRSQVSEHFRLCRRCLETFFSNRKAAVAILLALGLLLYLWPSWFRSREPASDATAWCLNDKLRSYLQSADRFDTFIRRWPRAPAAASDSYSAVEFIGNGYFAWSPTDRRPTLRMQHNDALSLDTEWNPGLAFSISLSNAQTSDAYILELLTGSVHKLQCLSLASHCIAISTVSYLHRVHSSAFVQDVSISNPLETSVDVSVTATSFKWTDINVAVLHGHKVQVVSTSVKIPNDSHDRVYVLSAVVPIPSTALNVKARSTENYQFLTVVEVSAPANPDLYSNNRNILEEKVKKTFSELVSKAPASLFATHVDVWSKLWQSGFEISFSRAPNALNADLINATLYYVLSNSPAPLHESALAHNKQQYLAALANPDRCYGSSNTLLYPSKLWSAVSSIDDVVDLHRRWIATLQKNGGCYQLLNAGADGVLQAMILSFGGIKFTHHHLQFATEPKDLHRDYHFRRILYDSSWVDIWVILGHDNKAVLNVAVNQSVVLSTSHTPAQAAHFYACDAGCLDSPVELSTERSLIPVKQTDPLTPILYVTADKSHIMDLKHTIHVKEVLEAPAHDHQLIAIHKHGHRLGGLPAFFWFFLIVLIVTFHLFLVKLIYNEYCRDSAKEHAYAVTRGRYSL